MNPSNPEDTIIISQSTNPYASLISELYQQAIQYQESGQFPEAIACYQQLINVDPQFLLAYQRIGYYSLKLEQFEQAVTAYQKVIELNPNEFWAYNNLGEAFIKLQRWQEAIPVYEKACQIDPNCFWVYNSLGECLAQTQQWEKAVPIYQKARELDPNYWGVYQKLGELLTTLERWEEVIPIYRRSLELKPDFFWSYIGLSKALIQLERWEEAIPVCQQAISIDPNFFWSYINLGDALSQLKRWQEAVNVYTTANQIKSDFFWSYKNLGDGLIQLQRWQEAIQTYQQALELNSTEASCYYNLGLAYLNLEQKKDAITCFETVLKLQPNDSSAQEKLNELLEIPAINSSNPSSHPLEPIDWLKYYPKSGQAPSYVLPKSLSLGKNPQTGKWQFPIPPQEIMLVFVENEEYYLNSGKTQVQVMLSVLRDCGYFLKTGSRILDFGCASGRILRQLADLSEICEIWGTDINADCIAWCQQNMSPPFHFFVGTTMPHLPFEDRYFDLIYAGSVFTHIDDLADAWLLELRRILKPGGLAFITIQERFIFDKIKDSPEQWLSNNNIWPEEQKQACIQNYFEYINQDFGMFTLGRDTRSLVFYDLDYFQAKWKPFFQVLAVKQEAYYWQTGVLLKRL
ncbi:class I SAM-dependent methyltransferase [Planktothrix mougeotii]|uniref:Tetratricopeptide repeat protein n=1 Tax=Planktothrix mougeotii LEGE 06226 TaxID=1828728 RepID=A0ABR9U5K7_9CYAN|nr:class I SAM-dependent methyltransferase [Planktothrix mougeotii]MBE9141730.1 tetratricopeptide repeat protein [Planktothrix mougeotii LEGE 06226]